MRHNLIITGPAFNLRPVEDDDAPFVLALRNNPKLNRYLHHTSACLANQLAWQHAYYSRPGDYYFVIERHADGTPQGLISIYDIDAVLGSGEWGRWILKPGSLAAIESAWLIYRCAFECLGLREVYSRTVADNASVVSFHDSCGIPNRKLLPQHFEVDGRRLDAIEHRLIRNEWTAVSPRLEQLARRTARRLQHG